jgi:hypothetical protein
MEKRYDRTGSYNTAEPAIPARIVIGVTGHRKIENPDLFRTTIQKILKHIIQMPPPLKNTPLLLSVLSPLAEGTDRLIAREVLKIPGSLLEVVLPLEKDAYINDFETDVSKKEFEELLEQAKSIRILTPQKSRVEAYKRVGQYIVEHCDIIIAIWDGKPSAGKGGTQEIVQYARAKQCPLVWIDSEDYSSIHFETGNGLDPRLFYNLDDYNRKSTGLKKLETRLNHKIRFFTEHAERAGLPIDKARPTIEYLMKRYVGGDKSALEYQHLYYRMETLIYTLAVVAVMIAALQVIFIPDQPLILLSEIILMLAILGIIWIGRLQQWHERWIDFRFLAERFRSALFMAIAGVDVTTLRPPRHLSLAYSPKDWIIAAFYSVWRLRPTIPTADVSTFEAVKQFLSEAWIQDQIHFHEATSQRHLARHHRMTIASYILFGLTIVVIILHVVGAGPEYFEDVFAFLAITLPAVAASIAAIRTHRDYLRNSMRSAEMVRHLKELKDRMARARDRDEFFEVIKETEETMLHENEDWRVTVRFHKTEAPV